MGALDAENGIGEGDLDFVGADGGNVECNGDAVFAEGEDFFVAAEAPGAAAGLWIGGVAFYSALVGNGGSVGIELDAVVGFAGLEGVGDSGRGAGGYGPGGVGENFSA